MPRRVRGIAPPGFSFDVWLPIDPSGREQRVSHDRSAAAFEVFGRLKPSSDVATAESEMRLLVQALATAHPEVPPRAGATEVFGLSGLGLFRGLGKTLLPVFAFLALLTIIAGCVLLIGCANVAVYSSVGPSRAVVRLRFAWRSAPDEAVSFASCSRRARFSQSRRTRRRPARDVARRAPARARRQPCPCVRPRRRPRSTGARVRRRADAATALLFGLTPAREPRARTSSRTQETRALRHGRKSAETRTGHRSGVPVFAAARLESAVRAKPG